MNKIVNTLMDQYWSMEQLNEYMKENGFKFEFYYGNSDQIGYNNKEISVVINFKYIDDAILIKEDSFYYYNNEKAVNFSCEIE